MALSNPLDILLTHDQWATRNILQACKSLTSEQFHQKFDMGPGSLHDTLTHILGALRGWGDMLASREQRPRLEKDDPRTPDELLSLLEELSDDITASAHAHPVDGIATGERGGRSFSFPRGGVITHVTTHAMHHRAQCLNMLRQLGVDPLPPSSVADWMLMVDPVN